MRTMDPSRKQRWRKLESERLRKSRITQGYIQKRYPEVYQEASEFFDFLNSKYPTKKDLRRTNEFELLKTGLSDEPTKRFYTRKTKKTTTTTTTFEDTMELTIPLMKNNTAGRQPDDATAGDKAIVQSTIDDMDIGISGIEPTFNQEIPDNILEEIMAELRGDPQIDAFFENISDDYFDHEELVCS